MEFETEYVYVRSSLSSQTEHSSTFECICIDYDLFSFNSHLKCWFYALHTLQGSIFSHLIIHLDALIYAKHWGNEMFRMYLTTAFPILASWCTFLDRVLLAIWFNFTVNIIKLDNELESYFHWRHSHRCLLTIWKIKFNFRLNLHYEWTQSTPSHEHKFTRTNCSSVFF